jgi:hypothetical protein
MKMGIEQQDPDDYELDDEYDLAALPIMPKGRYAPGQRAAKNLVLLEPDVAAAFPDDATVNEALRLVMQMARLPQVQTMAAKA